MNKSDNKKDIISWHKTGDQPRKVYYYDSKENKYKRGEFRTYYRNGHLKTRTQVRDSNLTGFVEKYDSAGKIMYRGYVLKGKKDSIYKFYDDSGNVNMKAYYSRGKLDTSIVY